MIAVSWIIRYNDRVFVVVWLCCLRLNHKETDYVQMVSRFYVFVWLAIGFRDGGGGCIELLFNLIYIRIVLPCQCVSVTHVTKHSIFKWRPKINEFVQL